jgi:hypothetical protein
MQVLSFVKLTCGGSTSAASSSSSSSSSSSAAAAAQSGVYFTRASGAGIFVAGTDRWACVLAGSCAGESVGPDPRSRRVLTRITRTLIAEFSEPGVGERRPARNSASQYGSLR